MKTFTVLVVACGVAATLVRCPALPAAPRRAAPARYPIVVRFDALIRTGGVLTASSSTEDCARRDLPAPSGGGLVLGISACDTASATGGAVQLDQTFEAPYQPTILTLRIAPPRGAARMIHSLRKNGRARIRFDGRSIWDARAASDAGMGRYFAIPEPDVIATLVIRDRAQHSLQLEVEPGVLWNIGSIEIRADPPPRSIRGIAYSPYRDCEVPGGRRLPTAADLDDDLARIVHSATAIRTYSATGVQAQAVAAAAAAGLQIYAGAWLDEISGDDVELQGLIEIARTGRAAGYIVGNEFYLRHQREGRKAVDYLLDRIRMFEASLPRHHAPVMTAEIDGLMFQWGCDGDAVQVTGIVPEYQPILDATEAVMVHIYPFWNGQPISVAASLAAARYQAIRDFIERRYPGKRVMIGETGWPSAGASRGAAVPGHGAQRQYMTEFMQLADAQSIDYFFFDAFDEGWKIEEPGHVGQHWGYADATRAAKYDISGTLIPAAVLAASGRPPVAVPGMCHAQGSTSSGSGYAVDRRADRAGGGAYQVYSDWLSDGVQFIPEGWMGDTDKIDLFECDRSAPHDGEMAVRATFSPDGHKGWAGVVWQDPASAWGTRNAGADLSSFDTLSFWVRGERGGEVVEFRVGGIGEPGDPYPDTIRPARSSGALVLSRDWRRVSISLAGADRSRVVGAFSWLARRCQNAQPITFFLDDIRFEAGPPAIRAAALARAPFHVYDDDASGCGHYAPSGFAGDVADVKLDPRNTDAPFRGRTAIRGTYRPGGAGDNGWAAVYWQDPAGNWGSRDGGFDLSWANVVTFWARGRKGGEVVSFIAGGTGTARDRYRDSLRVRTTGPVHLKRGWKRYTIDVRGQDLTRVSGGFAFSVTAAENPDGAEFFIDEIAYEK